MDIQALDNMIKYLKKTREDLEAEEKFLMISIETTKRISKTILDLDERLHLLLSALTNYLDDKLKRRGLFEDNDDDL